MEDKKNNLIQAKLAVMREVGYVQKTTAKELRYTFAGEADLIRALRPAMIEAGLALSPAKAEILSAESYETRSGSTMRLVRTRHVFRLSHESGEYEDIEVLGEAADSGDKTLPKCQTIAFKYALRQAFIIETGDDPDQFASVESAPKKGGNPWDHALEGKEGVKGSWLGKKLRELRDVDLAKLMSLEGQKRISEADYEALIAATSQTELK